MAQSASWFNGALLNILAHLLLSGHSCYVFLMVALQLYFVVWPFILGLFLRHSLGVLCLVS